MAPPWQNKDGFFSAPYLCVILEQAMVPVTFLWLLPLLCGLSTQGHHGYLPGRGGLQELGDLESVCKSPSLFALCCTARLNLNDIAKQPRLNILNNTATALIFITVILNIFITAFGVQKTGLYPTRNFGPY